MLKCYYSVFLILLMINSVLTECDESLNDMTKKAAVDCKSIKKCNLKTMNFTDRGKEYICKQVIEKEHKLYTFFKPFVMDNGKININAVKSKNFETNNGEEKKFILVNIDDVLEAGKPKVKDDWVRRYPQEQLNIDNNDMYDALIDDMSDKVTHKKAMINTSHRERHLKQKPSKKPGQAIRTIYSDWPKSPDDKLTGPKSDKHRESSGRIEYSSVSHPEKRVMNKTSRYRTAGQNAVKNTKTSNDIKSPFQNPVDYYDDVEEDDEFSGLYQDEAVTGSQRDVKPRYVDMPRTSFLRTRHNATLNTDQYLDRYKI